MDPLSRYISEKPVNSVETYERSIQDPIAFSDERLERYLQSPFAYNRVLTAEDPIEERKRLENIYHLSQYYNFDMGEVNRNYDAISRHYFGDDNITSSNQVIKDAKQAGKLAIEQDEIKSQYFDTPLHNENERQQLRDRLELLNSIMPPEDALKRSLPVASAKEFLRNVPNWIDVLEKTTPFKAMYDHMKQLNQLRKDNPDNPLLKGNTGSTILALIKYAGMAKEKTYIPTELSFLAGTPGMTGGAWKVYADREVASTYYELQNIEIKGDDGEPIKLDDDQIRAIALVAGGLKAAAEVWSDVVVLKGIPGIDKIFEKGFAKLASAASAKLALDSVLGKVLKKGVVITGSEMVTEWLQATMDLSANDFSIFLDENKELLQDFKVTKEEVFATYKEVLTKTALATAPLALLGMSGTGGSIGIKSLLKTKKVQTMIADAVAIQAESFTAKGTIETLVADPSFQNKIGTLTETTVLDVMDQKEALITRDFIKAMKKEVVEGVPTGQTPITTKDLETNERSIFERGSEEFKTARKTFKKVNSAQYFPEKVLSDEALLEAYQSVIVNFGFDESTEGRPGLSFEDFKNQRIEFSNAYINWRKTPNANKLFATMTPAAEVLQRVLDDNDVGDTGGALRRDVDELKRLIVNAQESTTEKPGLESFLDYKIDKDLQIEEIKKEIASLQKLGRSTQDVNQKGLVNQKIREHIEAMHGLTSSRDGLGSVMEIIARQIFNEDRLSKALERTFDNLGHYIDDFNSLKYQDFLSGKAPIGKAVETIIELFNKAIEAAETPEIAQKITDEKADITGMYKAVRESSEALEKTDSVSNEAGLTEEIFNKRYEEAKPFIKELLQKYYDLKYKPYETDSDNQIRYIDEVDKVGLDLTIAQYIQDMDESSNIADGLLRNLIMDMAEVHGLENALMMAKNEYESQIGKESPVVNAMILELDYSKKEEQNIQGKSNNQSRQTQAYAAPKASPIALDIEAHITTQAEKLFNQGKKVARAESFRKLLIGKMQKSLSNFLKLNGEKTIESIQAQISKNTSMPRAQQIELIQIAVDMVDGVKEENIEDVRSFITKNFYEKNGDPIPLAYRTSGAKIAKILMEATTLDLDVNLAPIGPRLSLQGLIQIKTEVDLLRYLGKLELNQARKGNYITDEIIKSEFLVYQKTVHETAGKASKGAKRLFKGVNFNFKLPYYWAGDIFGKAGQKLFWTEYLDAWNNRAKAINKRSIAVKTAINEKEYKWGDRMYEERFLGDDKFMLQDLLFMYMGRHDQGIRMNLINGTKGINPETMNEYLGKPGEEGLIDEALAGFEKNAAEVLAGDLQDVYNQIAGTYAAATGKRLGFTDNYLPMVKLLMTQKDLEADLVITMLRGKDQEQDPSQKNFLYERQVVTEENSHSGIRTDLWGLWQDYIQKQEHYVNMAEWVRTATEFIDDKTVAATITENYDKTWTDGIKKYIQDIANPGRLHTPGVIAGIIRTYTHNIALANLAYRSNIVLRQGASGVLYAEEAGIGNWFHAHREFIEAFGKDENGVFGNSLVRWIQKVDPASIEAGLETDFTKQKFNETKFSKDKAKLEKYGMWMIHAADVTTKAIGWKAVYDKYLDQLGPEEAIKKARDYTALTQPSSNRSSLPGIYRHSEMMNAFLMFTQQPVKLLNHFTNRAIPNLTSKDNKVAGLYGLVAMAISNTIIWSLTNRRVPEDAEDWAYAIIAGVLTWIPGVGRSMVGHLEGKNQFSTSQYKDPAIGILDLINPLVYKKSIDASRKGDMSKFNSQAERILKGFGGAFGIPSSAIRNLKDSIIEKDAWNFILGGPLGEKK